MMTKIELECLKLSYRDACHGAGATVRKCARATIENMCREAGVEMAEAFDAANLNMDHYFASRPF